MYVLRISTALKEFQEQWNHHGLCTENSLSPLQLYTEELLRNINSGHPTNIGTDYGVDSEGPFPVEDEDYQVVVPEININLSDAQMKIYATPVIHCKMMAILVKTFSHNVNRFAS